MHYHGNAMAFSAGRLAAEVFVTGVGAELRMREQLQAIAQPEQAVEKA